MIYDAGYKVLNGYHPFKDYWSITGPILAFLACNQTRCIIGILLINAIGLLGKRDDAILEGIIIMVFIKLCDN